MKIFSTIPRSDVVLIEDPNAKNIADLLQSAAKDYAILTYANLRGADLHDTDLRGIKLKRADFRKADLCNARLCGADLDGADFREADLGHADLTNADLSNADLSGTYLRGAKLIHAGTRSDGYEFYAHMRGRRLWILAGCRYFTLEDARKHWQETRGGTQLGDESRALLDNAERLAQIRGWIES